MIPCIKDKCLKYPVCKCSRTIRCKTLSEHYRVVRYNKLKEALSLSDMRIELWKELNKDLPQLDTIKEATGDIWNLLQK